MTRYQVRFEYPDKRTGRLKNGVRHVNARDEREAKARVRNAVPGSCWHWVNVQASQI
jgi:hypothetical protein